MLKFLLFPVALLLSHQSIDLTVQRTPFLYSSGIWLRFCANFSTAKNLWRQKAKTTAAKRKACDTYLNTYWKCVGLHSKYCFFSPFFCDTTKKEERTTVSSAAETFILASTPPRTRFETDQCHFNTKKSNEIFSSCWFCFIPDSSNNVTISLIIESSGYRF